MPDVDFLIAGGGLAGACAAQRLSEHGSVCVLERSEPAAGASGIAVGLVNPILGRRARPVWRMDEALAALEEALDMAGVSDAYDRRPTLRPAADDEQVARFRESARTHSEHCSWMAHPSNDWLHAPKGLLRIETGGMIVIERFVRRMLAGVDVRTRTPLTGWSEHEDCVEAEGITARYLLLTMGRGYTAFPEMMRLRLHQVKGQVVRVERPSVMPEDAPHVAGSGYAVSDSPGTLLCGSTYEHRFADLRPSRRATEKILKKVTHMLPALEGGRVLDERAGVRVTVPGIRLPMVGPLPRCKRVWLFSGLGAKGLLTGPLVAKELAAYLENPGRIPRQTRVRLSA